MASTIFGYFDSRDKAEEAANRLRRDFPDQDFAITVRQQSSNQTSNTMKDEFTSMNSITRQAMDLGATMGSVTGQMMGMVVGSVINAPFMMMNMAMAPMNANPGNMVSNMMQAMPTMSTPGVQNSNNEGNFTVKLQTSEPIVEINNILKEEGANQIKVYGENT